MEPREDIYQALFNLVKADSALVTASRRLRHWTEVAHTDQPALYMVHKGETATVQTKLPTKWEFHADLWLYANTGGAADIAPISIINPILDGIVTKLMPPTHMGEQTLGGLVERCRISGRIETDEGVLGDQAIVIIPVSIFLPQ